MKLVFQTNLNNFQSFTVSIVNAMFQWLVFNLIF